MSINLTVPIDSMKVYRDHEPQPFEDDMLTVEEIERRVCLAYGIKSCNGENSPPEKGSISWAIRAAFRLGARMERLHRDVKG